MSVLKMRYFEHRIGLIELIQYINNFTPTNEMTVVEIGTYAGEGTEIFANSFKHVITIDPHKSGYDDDYDSASSSNFEKVVEEFMERKSKHNNITYINKKSDDAINDLINESVDFVYIDGWHVYEQVKKDIENYKQIIKVGGFIGGHDYHSGWEGVINAINETIGNVDKTFIDTSWIKKL